MARGGRSLSRTRTFERDAKRTHKRAKDRGKLRDVIESLRLGEPLAPRHRDNALTGDWKGHCECHVEPDWLLIHRISPDDLLLVRTGTHANVFA